MQRMSSTRRPLSTYLKAVSAIVWKDLAAELRSRELLSAMLVFALLVILIFNFAIELQPNLRSIITPGVLWVTFAFAGTLGLNRSMAVEKDRGCLDGLLLAPVDRSAIYFGKAISNLAFMLIVAIIVLPIYSVLYNAWFSRVCRGRDFAFQHGSPDPDAGCTFTCSAFPGYRPGTAGGCQSQQWIPAKFAYERNLALAEHPDRL
jgi:hypothetical protein